jgi:hypothetical protein
MSLLAIVLLAGCLGVDGAELVRELAALLPGHLREIHRDGVVSADLNIVVGSAHPDRDRVLRAGHRLGDP